MQRARGQGTMHAGSTESGRRAYSCQQCCGPGPAPTRQVRAALHLTTEKCSSRSSRPTAPGRSQNRGRPSTVAAGLRTAVGRCPAAVPAVHAGSHACKPPSWGLLYGCQATREGGGGGRKGVYCRTQILLRAQRESMPRGGSLQTEAGARRRRSSAGGDGCRETPRMALCPSWS